MGVTAGILRRFPNRHFVETGTFRGDGVRAAMAAGFVDIHSIELSPRLWEATQAALPTPPAGHCVQLLCGSSADLLPSVIAEIDCPITFWLDAHGYEGSGVPDYPCPLLLELEAIAAHPVKTHTILIDDYGILGRSYRHDVTEAAVRELLHRINPEYLLVRLDNPHLPWDVMGGILL